MGGDIYLFVIPTERLVSMAEQAGLDFLLDTDVWKIRSTGMDVIYSLEEIYSAVWSVFLAGLVKSTEESEVERAFRHDCIRMGLNECFSLHIGKAVGPVDLLLSRGEIDPLKPAL